MDGYCPFEDVGGLDMWPRFTLYDIRVIGHYLGMLISFSTIALAVPFVTALACGEWGAASRYLLSMGITLVAGSALCFCRVQPGRLTRQQAMSLVGLSWIVLAFFASIPLFQSGHYATYLDALFEAVSGLTTTGASVVQDLDHISNADNMWRFVMHAIGGLGLIVVGMSLGIFGRSGGQGLFTSEGRSEHVVPNVASSARFISRISATFVAVSTIVVGFICLSMGISGDRAFLHSLWMSISAFMCAGFTPMENSIMYYHSFPLEVAVMLVMFMGVITFSLHSEVLRGRVSEFFKDTEVKAMALWLFAIAAVFALAASTSQTMSDLPALLRRDAFMIVSAATTTGFMVVTPGQLTSMMTSGAFLTIAVLMAVGGMSGSTAGGIKMQRIAMIAKSIVMQVKETLSPDSARVVVSYYHLGKRHVSPTLIREAMTVASLYAITYIAGALIAIAHGYEASQAIFDSISMASNGGLVSGVVAPGMPASLEVFFIFEMWAGRLEFLTLLALIVQIFVSLTPKKLSEWAAVKAIKRRRGDRL